MRDVDRDARVRPGHAHPVRHTAFASLRRLLGDERGDTMVEVLLSITLTGIAFGAILGGIAQVSLTAQTRNSNVLLEAALAEGRRAVELAPYTQVLDNSYAKPTPQGFSLSCLATVVPRLCFPLTGGDIDAANAVSLRAVTIEAAIDGQIRRTVVYKSDR